MSDLFFMNFLMLYTFFSCYNAWHSYFYFRDE